MTPWAAQNLEEMRWFRSLLKQIEAELDALSSDRHDRCPTLQKERDQLRERIEGWSLSLAKPDLSSTLRATLENDLESALRRQQEIGQQLFEAEELRRNARAIVDPRQVVDRLNRLADVLAVQNPTRTNLELSLHIDSIRCYEDGRVIVRTCKLGALAGSTELFAEKGKVASPGACDSAAIAARPRRRSVRRITDGGENSAQLQAVAHEAADVNRFAGLGEEWFWEDEFTIPEATCWSREHAEEVAQLRETGMTHHQLAEHFRVTTPTIRNALAIWESAHPDAVTMPRKMPRRRWEDEHGQEAFRLHKLGQSISQLAEHFGKCVETIRKGLRLGEQQEAGNHSSAPRNADGNNLHGS